MTFEIITKYGTQTYSAKWKHGNAKATCTSGHEFAAKALADKLIAQVKASGEMNAPIHGHLEKIEEPSDYTQPVTWRLTLTTTSIKPSTPCTHDPINP